jgi:hypothetical protein
MSSSQACVADLLSSVSVPLVQEHQPVPMQQQTAVIPAKPKKKRVRRQKLELAYLRELVGKLEEQMTRLRARQAEAAQKDGMKTEHQAPSIWKGIAERQHKERERVEEKNQKLRVSLEGQLKLATKLQRLLQKRPRDEELAGAKRFKRMVETMLSPTDDEIFADQLAHVQRAHLDVDELFSGPDFTYRATSFCNLHVMNDSSSDTGVAYVTKANSMLPFDVNVSERAFWRAFAEEGPRKLSYFHEERASTDNLVARSYGLNFNAGTFRTNVRGMQTYRKCVDGDRIIIMWKSLTEPVEINDTKLRGLRCNQIGWIVLSGINLSGTNAGCVDTSSTMMSTSLQSYCKLTVVLQDDIVNQELQVGALTNFVVNSHDVITDVCGKLLNEVLVEEDWNSNGWLDSIAL